MEPCEFTQHLQARRLKELVEDLRQYSPDRLEAFEAMIEKKNRLWLTVDEIAEDLQVHRETVRRWIRTGQLKSFKVGRQYRIKPEDIAEFIQVSDHAR